MPKTYLRYVLDRTVGVIATPQSNVAVDSTGTYACTACLEDVGVWMVKTGRQVCIAVLARGFARRSVRCRVLAPGGGCQPSGAGGFWTHPPRDTQIHLLHTEEDAGEVTCLAMVPSVGVSRVVAVG